MKKRVIIFDLDGTLAESKQPLDSEMSLLLTQLLHERVVAIISGGSFEQFEKQFLSSLEATPQQLEHLILLPTTGATLYQYSQGVWHQQYQDTFTPKEVALITDALHLACEKFAIVLETPYGPAIENRGGQITLSPLGQTAPIAIKQPWDPDQQKRIAMVAFLQPLLPLFTLTIGGMRSIDITRDGVDKASGIRKIQEYLSIPLSDMLFVGDALYPGGNDAPALTTGIECRSVDSIEETKEVVQTLLHDVSK